MIPPIATNSEGFPIDFSCCRFVDSPDMNIKNRMPISARRSNSLERQSKCGTTIEKPGNEMSWPLKRMKPRSARMNPASISPITAGKCILEKRYPNNRAKINANAIRSAISYIVVINLLHHLLTGGIGLLHNIFLLVDGG